MLAGKASRAVRRPGEWDAHAPSGGTVGILSSIANGIDVGVRRAHEIVGGNPAARADLEAGVDRKLHVRAHAEAEQDNVGGEARAVSQQDGSCRAVLLLDRRDPAAKLQLHPVGLKRTVEWLSHLGVEERQHLGLQLDERDCQTAVAELLGDFEADKAAADHNRAACVGYGGRDPVGVFEIAQRKHAARLRTGHRRHDRASAWGEDELVIGLDVAASGGVVLHGHGLGCPVNRHHLLTCAHVDAEALGEKLRGCDQQLGPVLDLAAQVVGQATVREGDIGVFLE